MTYFGHSLLHWLLTHMIAGNQGRINHVPEHQALFSYLKIATNKQTNNNNKVGRETAANIQQHTNGDEGCQHRRIVTPKGFHLDKRASAGE